MSRWGIPTLDLEIEPLFQSKRGEKQENRIATCDGVIRVLSGGRGAGVFVKHDTRSSMPLSIEMSARR